MHRTNIIFVRLLAGFIVVAILVLASSHVLDFYYQPAYSHALTLDENSSLLELSHEIYVGKYYANS